ncbi:XRE family transcriptional regulator [Enterococcus sp. LJL120]
MREIVLPQMIDYYRKQNNLTMKDLGIKLNKSESAVSRWIKGDRSPMVDDLEKLTSLFEVSVEELMFGGENTNSSIESIYNKLEPTRQAKVYSFAEAQLKQQNKKIVPLYGATAANPTELAYGDIDLDTTVETSVPDKADCALVVKGNSMEPEYQNGDIVFYKAQPTVENGEMAIVEIEGTGVTLKKVYMNYDDNMVILRSLNGDYDDRELEPEKVRILGKVVK